MLASHDDNLFRFFFSVLLSNEKKTNHHIIDRWGGVMLSLNVFIYLSAEVIEWPGKAIQAK